MKAEIITIGDELLIGQVINTNQAYIAEKLNGIGIHINKMTTVGDDLNGILAAFTEAWNQHDVVIVTGGLGPTHDDVTKKAACEFFSTELVRNEELLSRIQELTKQWNRPWSASYEEQTMFPGKAKLVPNPVGTAGGMLFEEGIKSLIILPGVPYEMKEMVDRSVVEILAAKVSGSVIRHLTLKTTGIPESMLATQLGNLDDILQGAKLAFLPSSTGVRMRITVMDETTERADQRIREIEQRIREKVQKYIYGLNDEELEETIGRILTKRELTLAIAESCTGGLIASKITDVSGSSGYFERAVIAYSNRSKSELLGVPESLIAEHGAVSREVAEAMAEGVRRVAGTDIGISTTGIAGPTGGSADKPVGLVWIGYADADSTTALRFQFGTERLRVKERASQAALELLRRKLLRIE